MTHLISTEVHQLIVVGNEAPLAGARFLATWSRGVAPKTRGSGITYDPDPARVSHLSGSQASSATPLRGHRKGGSLYGDPQGVEGVGKGLCTSVTASRMTDAYGASTPVGVHRSPLFTMS